MQAIFDWLLHWSEVIGALGSVLLSSVLVYFYREMRNVQRTQAEIQEKQTELIKSQTEISRANHEPLLSVQNISFSKGDRVKFEIENEGNGIARNLTLLCTIETENEYYDIQPTGTPLTESEDSSPAQGSNLAASDNGQFNSSVIIGMDSSCFSDTLSRFTTATAKLNYTGTQSATVHLFIQCENILGETREEPIEPAQIWIANKMSIEEAFSQSMDPIAEDLPFTGSCPIDTQHIGTNHNIGDSAGFNINFKSMDMIIDQALILDVITSEKAACEIKRSQGTIGSMDSVTTVKEDSNQTVEFNGNEQDRLKHGELLHVFASTNRESWQVDLIGAGDRQPRDQPHISAIKRRQLMHDYGS